MEPLQRQYETLKQRLRALGSVAVAFSNGVDSTLLLWCAHEALGEQAVAITAVSRTFPQWEQEEAQSFCRRHGIRQILCHTDELSIPGFRENPRNRCYLCKKALFGQLKQLAQENGLHAVVEGSNLDDDGDYRPGRQAIRELGIYSPLHDAGLTKADIRALSRQLGLPTWDKPSCACLASRIPYGEEITAQKLAMADRAEDVLRRLGFRQLRVRIHGDMARIEVLPEELPRLMEPETRRQVNDALRALGFAYVTADLQGYRTGSLNETLLER